MAHPQHNFTSNFNGSEGHNAELTLNINGTEHKYTPAGNDKEFTVTGAVRIDVNLDGSELVERITTVLDGDSLPLLVQQNLDGTEDSYTYVGLQDDEWLFGRVTTTHIDSVGINTADGSVRRETLPLASDVAIVSNTDPAVYTKLRTAVALGHLPVLNYQGTYATYVTIDNNILKFATEAADPNVESYVYTVASDNTVTATPRNAGVVRADSVDTEPGTLIGKLEVVDNVRDPEDPNDPPLLELEVTVDGQGKRKVAINEDNLREAILGINNSINGIIETIDEMDVDSVPRAYLHSTLNRSAGDSVTTSTPINVFAQDALVGDCFEFEQTTTIDDTPFGYVWIEPGTYLINAAVTLQWVGSPRGTFIAKVGSVMGENFDFSQEQEIKRNTTRVVTIPSRTKLAVNVTYDAGTPVMGFWIQSMQVVKLAGGMSQTNIIHDSTLNGQGSVVDPLGVMPAAFGKIKDIPNSISAFRSGDVIPVDGPSGTAKMTKDGLLTETAQNALAGNVAPEFDPTKPDDEGGYAYYAGIPVIHNGSNYVFTSNKKSGAWDPSVVEQKPLSEAIQLEGIGEAVNEWLNAHPEATTTVNDNSLTYQKLVKGTLQFVTSDMFGAAGDGVADDTEALTNFLNYDCGVKIFRPGVYNVKGIAAENLKNCVIYGNGAKLNMINVGLDNPMPGGRAVVFRNKNNYPNANFDNGFLEIYDLEIDGNADQASITQLTSVSDWLSCLELYCFDYVQLSNVYVHDTFNGNGIALRSCNRAVVENCVVKNIGVAAWNYPDYVSFPNYQWDGIGCSGRFYDNDSSSFKNSILDSVVIRNCLIDNVAGCFASFRNCLNAKCCNNVIKNNHGYGIEDGIIGIDAENKTFVRDIKENYMYNSGNIYEVSESAQNGERLVVNVSNNIMDNVFGDYGHKFVANKTTVLLENTSQNYGFIDFTFSNNFVKFATKEEIDDNAISVNFAGMSIQYSGKVTIENNTFECEDSSSVSNMVCSITKKSIVSIKNNYVKGVRTGTTPFTIIMLQGFGNRAAYVKNNRISLPNSAAYGAAFSIGLVDDMPVHFVENTTSGTGLFLNCREAITTPNELVCQQNKSTGTAILWNEPNPVYSYVFASIIITNNIGKFIMKVTGANKSLTATKALIVNNIGTIDHSEGVTLTTSVEENNI